MRAKLSAGEEAGWGTAERGRAQNGGAEYQVRSIVSSAPRLHTKQPRAQHTTHEGPLCTSPAYNMRISGRNGMETVGPQGGRGGNPTTRHVAPRAVLLERPHEPRTLRAVLRIFYIAMQLQADFAQVQRPPLALLFYFNFGKSNCLSDMRAIGLTMWGKQDAQLLLPPQHSQVSHKCPGSVAVFRELKSTFGELGSNRVLQL